MDNYSPRALIDKFMGFLKSQNKSVFTIIAYKKDLEQFSGYLASQEKNDVRDVKKEDVAGFINKLLNDNYTKKSASRKLNSARTFFRYLKNEGVVDQNPSLEVPHPKYSQAAPRILSKLEYRALRDFAKEDARTYALIEILLQTGVKIGEIANIQLEDVKDQTLIVRPYGKNPAREIPLNKAGKKAIEDYLKQRTGAKNCQALFITRNGRPILVRNIRQIINRCFREVEIDNATVNDLRNTFIVHQLVNGASIEYIAKIVGHRRLSSTERFINMIKQEVIKKDKLGEL